MMMIDDPPPQFVEVKTSNPQNPAVVKVQEFAVPSNPPGPNKFQQAQNLHQSSLENTIRNISRSQSNVS